MVASASWHSRQYLRNPRQCPHLRLAVVRTTAKTSLILFLLAAQLVFAYSDIPDPKIKTDHTAKHFRFMPASFETNVGQYDPGIRFASRSAGYSVYFQNHEVDFVLARGEYDSLSSDSGLSARIREPKEYRISTADVLVMHLEGATSTFGPAAVDRLPGVVNYFTGRNPANWHTRIPTFSNVQYIGVYPGINLVYYGTSDSLEFDFQLLPGASVSRIHLHFTGAKRLVFDAHGNLVLTAPHGSVRFLKPVLYQIDSESRRIPVQGRLRLFADGTVGFAVGRYDSTRALIVDPILDYSTYLGNISAATAIAVDSNGEAFVAGYAQAGLPTTSGSFQPTYPTGKSDQTPVGDSLDINTAAFIAKLNNTGTGLVYCTYLSGTQNDAADAIAVDAAGNAYIAGATASPDFPVTDGAFQTANHASKSGTGFITELDNSGSGLVFSTFLGGSVEAFITGIGLDGSGNVFVTGDTADLDFPVTPGAFQTSSPANPIIGGKGFITKLAAGGQKLIYSTYIGGSKWDLPYGIAIDASGNAYIAGGTQSKDFPTTPGAFQTTSKATIFNLLGGSFVSKLNAAGSALVYSTYLGGSYTDVAYAITVDSGGNAYVTGFATSPDFPTTPGVFQPTLTLTQLELTAEMSNVFITKLNPSGSSLVYSTFLGGNRSLNPGAYGDVGLSIAVDSSGNAYLAGSTEDIDFPITTGALQTQNITQLVSGDLASFVAKIDPTASKVLYSTYLTGTGDQSFDPAGVSCDCAESIALDRSQNLYVAGRTVSTDFPTTLGTIQNQSENGASAFVTEFNRAEMQQLPPSITTLTASPNPQTDGQSITFTATVKSTSGSNPSGTVGFSYQALLANGTPFSFGPWNNVALDGTGTAEFTTTSLPSGSVGVVAYYLGDAQNSPSQGSMTETVNQIPTTTTITANTSSALYGTPLTFTAIVVETASGKPAQGSVVFVLGSTSLGVAALDSTGQATWTSGSAGGGVVLPVGSQAITAEFSSPDGASDQKSQGSVTVNITPLGATAVPTFSPAGGTYAAVQNVTISCATAGAVIYYTTDGSTPTATNARYVAGLPIAVSASETIKAIAIAQGDSASAVASATYTIDLPPPNFTLGVNPNSVTAHSGGQASVTLTVTPQNGFNSMVTFGCTGLPSGYTCTLNPSAITPNGGAATTTLTFSVPASSAAVPLRNPLLPSAVLTLVAGLLVRRRGFNISSWFLWAILAAHMVTLTACGRGGGGTPAPTTYSVTVTATSGSLQQKATISLTVN
jgi:hypothetical protein